MDMEKEASIKNELSGKIGDALNNGQTFQQNSELEEIQVRILHCQIKWILDL